MNKISASFIFAALLVGLFSNCSAAPIYETDEEIRSVSGPPLFILDPDAGTNPDSGQATGNSPGTDGGPAKAIKHP
jgi:hypothetical protein